MFMGNRSRGAALLIVFTLLLSLFLPTSHSAQKITAGASCKGLNERVDYKNKTYTCIKSGKKLVWNKGSAIKTMAPGKKPTPTPTITQTQKLLTPLEKLNADIYQRYVVAEKKISPSFNFVRCPNANKEMAEITEKAYIDAYSFWVPIYKASAKVNWLLMSEKDWDCWYETTATFEGSNATSLVRITIRLQIRQLFTTKPYTFINRS